MAYSFMTAVSDGTLKSMPITFNYMKEDDIVVHQNVTRLTKGIDYTINNNIITFAKVIPALDRIAVDRMSQRDSLRVNFVEGATFSRENMDDVLTQMLYLTQEAMEGSVDRISPTGVLDLAGNRIINLGDPVELQDAVPLHLVVDAEKSVYASEAKCKQYRDEALGYKDEAFTYADRAYASELNAKKSEEIALQLLAESAEASKLVTENLPEMRELAASAEESADRAGAMVDRVEDALVAVEEYNSRVTALENNKLNNSGNCEIRDGTLSIAGYSPTLSLRPTLNPDHDTDGSLHLANFMSAKDSNNNTLWGIGQWSSLSKDIWITSSQYNTIIKLQSDRVYFNKHLYIGDSKVYHELNKPSPKEIGAFGDGNIFGTLASGAMVEKYTIGDWDVTKRADGTMKLVYKIVRENFTFTRAGMTTVFSNLNFPEKFKDVPILTGIVNVSGGTLGAVLRGYISSNSISNTYAGVVSANLTDTCTNSTLSVFLSYDGEWLNRDRVSTLEEPEIDDSILGNLDEPVYYDTPQVLPYDPEI